MDQEQKNEQIGNTCSDDNGAENSNADSGNKRSENTSAVAWCEIGKRRSDSNTADE